MTFGVELQLGFDSGLTDEFVEHGSNYTGLKKEVKDRIC
jgi:hypothetical protein